MAETPTHVDTDLKVLHLYFDTKEDEEIPLEDFVRLFDSIQQVIDVLGGRWDSFSGTGPEVYVVDLEMHSPLEVALALVNFTKERAAAILAVMQNIIFYHQEADRREAIAAQEWEETYARRLANLKEAVQVARQLRSEAPEVQRTVDSLLEPVRRVQSSTARLVKAKLEEDEPDEQFILVKPDE